MKLERIEGHPLSGPHSMRIGPYQPPFRHWVYRKVRKGCIQLFGQEFVPDARFTLYDGRLEGMCLRFGTYRANCLGFYYSPFLAMCGKAPPTTSDEDMALGIVNDTMPWY